MSRVGQWRRVECAGGGVLPALKMVYPAAVRGGQLLRSLLVIRPDLKGEHVGEDLAYLQEKGYVRRVTAGGDEPVEMPWRRRYFRLTAAGAEAADACARGVAVEV